LQADIVQSELTPKTGQSMMMHSSAEPYKRKRGENINRSKNRDRHRDAVMRGIFSKPGFASVIARKLGLTPQNISAWNRVPAHHVLDISPLIGLSPEDIRPDIFGGKRRRHP
jgi:Putative antitoxin of bacterial toxin-antitoxin system, YdaS/YdaT